MAIFKSNFTKIAENTTKYYLELKNRYYNKFENEISLLAGNPIKKGTILGINEK